MGFYVGRGGYLSREDENGEDGKKNGKKNGNGNGGNGNGGNGNGGSNGGGNGGGGNGGGVSENTILEKRDGKSAKDKGYSLRDWFKGGGWKQTGGKYDGKPCARQPGQKTKPFCRDADDRASMSKDERNRRAAKKRREDPNPDRKGKAKMVTDSYDFSNWRDEFKALEFETVDIIGTEPLKPTEGLGSKMLGEKCWKGYEKKGMKTMFGKRYPNCVKKEETEVTKEGVLDAALETDKKMGELHKKVDNDVKRMKKGKKFKEEFETCPVCGNDPCQCLEGNLEEMASEKDINKKLQKKVNSKDLNPAEYIKNTRLMPGSGIIKKLPEGNAGPSTPVKQYDGKFMPNPGAGRPGKVRLKPGTPAALRLAHKEYSDWKTELFEGDGDHEYEMARRQLATIKNAVSRLEKKMGETGEGELKAWVQSKLTRSADDIDTVADYMTNEQVGPDSRGAANLKKWTNMSTDAKAGTLANRAANQAKGVSRAIDNARRNAKNVKITPGSVNIRADIPEELVQEGEKDACYHKVKSRYSVWPSAYASGALVKCRKVGAKNWGNKTKKEEVQYLNTEDYQRIQEYGNVYTIIVLWRGKSHRLQLFFQGTARPSRDEVKNEVEKIYPGGMVSYYFPSATDPGKPIIVSTRS